MRLASAGKTILWALVAAVLALFCVWSSLAIYFSNIGPDFLRASIAALFLPASLTALALIKKRLVSASAVLAANIAVVVAWGFVHPTKGFDWAREYAVKPNAEINGRMVTFKNIRDFRYKTEDDFQTAYYDKTFDLDKIMAVDFALVYWDNNTLIAHTLLSFGFEGGDYLCFSAETRRAKGQPQTAVRGLFKQYELAYVVGDERDIIGLRVSHRGEQVYLYPANMSRENARKLFLEFARRVAKLHDKPEYYNTITQNCTTSMIPVLKSVYPDLKFDIRILMNGLTDRRAYEKGNIKSHIRPFEKLKEACHVNSFFKGDCRADDFSQKIRLNFPRENAAERPQ